jgi:hypothetical protein
VWAIYERVTGKQRPDLFASTREPDKALRNEHPPM